jgi:hypothetical protein
MGESGEHGSGLRSERGAITSGMVIGLALAVVAGYILLGFTGGDPDRHGRLPVPANTVLELPGGESKVYFIQGTASTEAGLPADLNITVRPPDALAEPVRIEPRSEQPDVRDGESIELIGAVNPEEEGSFEVTVTSQELGGRVAPQVAFGQSAIGAIGERLDSVVDRLLGPLGIAVLALLAAIWFVPRLKLAIARSRE